MNDEPILRKAYYSIGEVCDLTDLKPHVLRYWESQFDALHPTKNRAGNRVYRPREVELVLLVKHLLYEEKFTIDGARQKLRELRKEGDLAEERQEVAGPELFQVMKEELQRVRELLTLPDPPPGPRSPAGPPRGRPIPHGGDDPVYSGPRPTGPDAAGPGARDSSDPDSSRTNASDDRYPQLQLEVDDG
ncbi:MAG: MerR family transcriptional regulator [Gemmatimonadales bacterium]|nr:MAG: MerR family transcriptional regulator [Gemmatimonadales bacterium]